MMTTPASIPVDALVNPTTYTKLLKFTFRLGRLEQRSSPQTPQHEKPHEEPQQELTQSQALKSTKRQELCRFIQLFQSTPTTLNTKH